MYTLNVYENDWSYIEFLFGFFVRRHKNHLWILQNNSHKKKLQWNNLLMIEIAWILYYSGISVEKMKAMFVYLVELFIETGSVW